MECLLLVLLTLLSPAPAEAAGRYGVPTGMQLDGLLVSGTHTVATLESPAFLPILQQDGIPTILSSSPFNTLTDPFSLASQLPPLNGTVDPP